MKAKNLLLTVVMARSTMTENLMKLIGISVLITFLMLPFTANAQFSGGDGSEGNPYIITTAAELAQLTTLVNVGNADYNGKYYKLNNDIDLSDYKTDIGWIPIGRYENSSFNGVFDGNSKKITGLYISSTDGSYDGLFGYIKSATIKNLSIIDANIPSSYSSAGIVVGYMDNNSSVSNCYSTGSIISLYSSGYNYGYPYVGGVVGYNSGSVSNCYSFASVSTSASAYGAPAGGVAGGNNGSVSNCYSTGSVSSSGYNFSGGVVGLNDKNGTVSNCYSTGSVSSSGSSAGGVVGINSGGFVSSCYSTGVISSSEGYAWAGKYAGGVVGDETYAQNGSGTLYHGWVRSCAALNPSINRVGNNDFYFGRIAGADDPSTNGTLTNNIAFTNMLNPDNNTTWNNKSSSDKDGEDINAQSINADGTLGGRFTSENGWTTQNGKLPGLFGNTVNMPEYLVGNNTGVVKPAQEVSDLIISPNPATDFITVSGLQNNEMFYVYNINGQQLFSVKATGETQQIPIGHLPAGIYFVKTSSGQSLKWIKK